MKQEYPEKKEQFTLKHLTVIAVCAFLLILLTLMKHDFSLFSQKTDVKEKMTYEKALAMVSAEDVEIDGGMSETVQNENADRNKISLLDPSLYEGQVAGASTEMLNDLDLPVVQTFLNEDDLVKINIFTTDVSNTETVANYFLEISSLDIQNKIADLLYLTGSGEQVNTNELDKTVEVLITAMLNVKAPKVLEKYHKLNLLYYFIMGEFAKSSGEEQKELGKQIFSLQSELIKLKTEIENQFKVQ